MKVLLDTAVFLKTASDEDISPRARDLLLRDEKEFYVSLVSFWEIVIKYSTGKVTLPDHPDRFLHFHREKLGADLLPLDAAGDSPWHGAVDARYGYPPLSNPHGLVNRN